MLIAHSTVIWLKTSLTGKVFGSNRHINDAFQSLNFHQSNIKLILALALTQYCDKDLKASAS